MKIIPFFRLVMCLVSMCCVPLGLSQARRATSAAPQIDVEDYLVQAVLSPDAHEMKVAAQVTFKSLEATDVVVFEMSENLSVSKVTDDKGVEIEFGQDETGPGLLTLRFAKPLEAGSVAKIKFEYSGGFDRDRYSRLYMRDESSAYVGMDGTYVLYSAKWFPVNKFLVDRATARLEVTVPLGMTAIGAGVQAPVVTKGISETFGWLAKQPILPNSLLAGRYFERKVQAGEFFIDCFAREDRMGAIQQSAEVLGKILGYYQRTFGASASGTNFRLVEVDDRLVTQPGMLGTVFITHRELAQGSPPMRQLARRAAYQWWMETVGVQSPQDLWLSDGLAFYSAAMYLGESGGPTAFSEEVSNLAVQALTFESKSAVRMGIGLGYRSEAYDSVVGAKGAWVLHMLRELLGSVKFGQLLQNYAQQYAAVGGSTSGFQKLAEQLYGKELGWFIAQWIDAIGVPTLQADYLIYRTADGFRVSGSVKQERDLFRMPLDIDVITKGKTERGTIELSGKSTPFDVRTFAIPTQVVLDPGNKILRDSPELQIAVQISRGNDLRQRGEYVEAVRAYESALKLNPRKSSAHYWLAETFYQQFNLQAAANSFRDALNGDKDPKWIEVWSYIYLGKIYDILNQRQRAMAEYNKALNTKDDFNGAQAEAKRWLDTPFTRERTVMEKEAKQPN